MPQQVEGLSEDSCKQNKLIVDFDSKIIEPSDEIPKQIVLL